MLRVTRLETREERSPSNREEENAARFSILRQEKGSALHLNAFAFFDRALRRGALILIQNG